MEYNCEPEVIDIIQDYQGTIDGSVEFDTIKIYNCESCVNIDCQFWKKYN